MSVDFTHIVLGDVLTMLTIVGTILVGAYSLLQRLSLVDASVAGVKLDVSDIRLELKKQTDILVELAQTRERMNSIEKRLDDLISRPGG